MPEPRRAGRKVAGIFAGAAVIAALGLGVRFGFLGSGQSGSKATSTGPTAVNEQSLLGDLNEGLSTGNPQMLGLIYKRALPAANAPRQALSEQDAVAWIDALSALRTGFPRFNPPGRVTAVSSACLILDKFAVEPAPAQWALALKPVHDMLIASLADAEEMPRYTGLMEAGRLWIWMPGRSLTPFEEQTLGEWKSAIHKPVVRCLGARDAQTRMAAVACLGKLPIDDAAAPGVRYVDDPIPAVRKQAVSSYSQRSTLLTHEMLFARLHDSDSLIREMATLILKTRGLTQEQISLGGLIYSPKAAQRVSVIPLLKDRTDIDPVIWLIQLSRDSEEMVRITAIEALAKHKSPSVQRRLAEMARSDGSEAVRRAASKLVPSAEETTAALPPLPGSSSLNPKAN
jgi:HEAT repeat protein